MAYPLGDPRHKSSPDLGRDSLVLILHSFAAMENTCQENELYPHAVLGVVLKLYYVDVSDFVPFQAGSRREKDDRATRPGH